MEDVYIKNEEGLRVKASDYSIVNKQLFLFIS
jgi:hypothetical protein